MLRQCNIGNLHMLANCCTACGSVKLHLRRRTDRRTICRSVRPSVRPCLRWSLTLMQQSKDIACGLCGAS